MHDHAIKISLNLPALERLLGGDSTLEAELRHQIVNEFAKRHLTALVKTEAMAQAAQAVKAEATKIFAAECGTAVLDGWNWRYTIRDHLTTMIRELVAKAFAEEVAKFEARYHAEKLEDKLERRLQTRLNTAIDTAVNKIVTQEMAQRKEAISAAVQNLLKTIT